MVASALGTLLPEYGFTQAESGTIALLQALGLVVASLASGLLIDRAGIKLAMLAGLALLTLALLALPGAHGSRNVGITMLIVGFGSGTLATATNTLVSAIADKQRAAALNVANLFFGLGGLLTPLIGAWLFAGKLILLCYLLAVLMAAVLAAAAASSMPAGAVGFRFSGAAGILARPALALFSLYLFLYVACEVSMWNWLASYLVTQGIPEKTALATLSLGFALGLLLGRVAAARIVMHVSGLNLTLGSAILMAALTYTLLQTRDPWIAALLVFCTGLAMAPVFPTTIAMVGDAFPVMTGTAMGIAITSGWIGLAVSSRLIGVVASYSGDLKTALLTLPAFSVLMIAVNVMLRNRPGTND